MVKIKSHEMYEALLRRINALMEAKPGSDEEFELKILAELVEKYESEHYPIEVKE
jgi:HTH-type transcriptional regulator/antitoxin HigA